MKLANHSILVSCIFIVAIMMLPPLWNIPHTILLRHLCGLTLLVVVLMSRPNWKDFFYCNKALILLFLYLIIQLIFFSTDHIAAFRNFKSEWLKFILFALTGIGCGFILSRKKLWYFNLYAGCLFSIPIFIHLGLSLFKGISTGEIPARYWGINETHGDLGYTSIHAVVFLSVYLLFQAKSTLHKLLVSLILIACVLSLLIAGSRAGILFLILTFCFVLVIRIFHAKQSSFSYKRVALLFIGILFLIFSIFQVGSFINPQRWNLNTPKFEIAFKGDAIKINCEGIGVLEKIIEQEGTEFTPQIQSTLDSINGFDGARIVALRSALQLIYNHPMGINQSRLAYDIALEKSCGGKPKIELLNSHNGWADTALGIGVIGALLYFLVLCNFMYTGISVLKHKDPMIVVTGIALLSLGFIWLLRSMFDSAQRDQMLEMQIFTICILSAIIFFKQQLRSNTVTH